MRTQIALVFCCLGLAGVFDRVEAQTPEGPEAFRVEAGVGGGYFPAYPYEDDQTRYWGVNLVGRVFALDGLGIELGFAHVPQATTTSSAAPRLTAVHAVAVRSLPIHPEGRARLLLGAGAAWLTLEPQSVDCGDFPLCAEWSPQGGTRTALAGQMAVTIDVLPRLGAGGVLRLFKPLGDEWSPGGDRPWVTNLSVGFDILLGAWGDPPGLGR